jgi:Flp pilus assembly protein CpaB
MRSSGGRVRDSGPCTCRDRRRHENKKIDATAQTILQNIKVLTSGQKVVQEKDQPVVVNVVTLEVTPAEAE